MDAKIATVLPKLDGVFTWEDEHENSPEHFTWWLTSFSSWLALARVLLNTAHCISASCVVNITPVRNRHLWAGSNKSNWSAWVWWTNGSPNHVSGFFPSVSMGSLQDGFDKPKGLRKTFQVKICQIKAMPVLMQVHLNGIHWAHKHPLSWNTFQLAQNFKNPALCVPSADPQLLLQAGDRQYAPLLFGHFEHQSPIKAKNSHFQAWESKLDIMFRILWNFSCSRGIWRWPWQSIRTSLKSLKPT